MNILRRTGLVILSSLFVFFLFATAFDVGLIRTTTDPGTIKRLAAESGIYDSLVPSLLKQQGTISTSFGSLSANDPDIKQAIDSAVSPQYVRQNIEEAIDNVYKWLNGDISRPDFKIGLTDQRASIADSVSATLKQKLAGLPTCSFAKSRAIARSGSFDIANATCLPYGVTAASLASNVKNSILNDRDIFKDASIDASDIKNGDTGKSVFEQAGVKNLPKQYQRAKKTPWILGILTILAGVGIVFLSETWHRGLRHIGINLLVVGIVMLLFSWALSHIVNTNIAPRISVDNRILQQDLRSLVVDIGHQINKNYWIFGGLYAVLGAGTLAGTSLFYRRINRAKSPTTTPSSSS